MKTFGLVIAAGKGSTFEANVRARLSENSELAAIIMPHSKRGAASDYPPPNSPGA